MLPALSVTGPMGMPLVSATVEIEIASEEDREGPDDVEDARQDLIDDAAEEAGDERDDRREEAAERCRGRADDAGSCGRRRACARRRRGPGCRRPGSSGGCPTSARSASRRGRGRPVLSTMTGCCLPSISVVPSTVDSNGCVCATLWAYHPASEARHHDHDEAREGDERDPVAQQAPACQRPRAAADDAGRLAHVADRNDLRHSWSPGPLSSTGPTPGPRACRTARSRCSCRRASRRSRSGAG